MKLSFSRSLCSALVWLLLCIGISFCLAMLSPHGLSAFFLTGAVLVLVGGIGQFLSASISTIPVRRDAALRMLVTAGAAYGMLAYTLAEAIFERSLAIPHDWYQWAVLFFSMTSAVVLNCFVNLTLFRTDS